MAKKQKFFNPLTAFILLALVLSVIFAQQKHIFRPKAAEPTNTQSLLAQYGRGPTAKPTAVPFVCTACKADLTRDGVINGGDMSKLVPCFGKKATDMDPKGVSCNYADINNDGEINDADRGCIQSQFLQKCTPPSPSPTPNPVTCTACEADLNKDGVVNGGDASALSSCWGKTTSERGSNGMPCVNYDIDKNGVINEGDLSCISKQMLQMCKK